MQGKTPSSNYVGPKGGRPLVFTHSGSEPPMIRDLLIAALIVVIAVVLGIVVHPLLLLLLILAAFWLFGRHRAW